MQLPFLRIPLFLSLLAVVSAASGPTLRAEAAKPVDWSAVRVVFVGDSITGQGRNRTGGYVNEIEKALRAVYPGGRAELVALGGSGQSVGGWTGIEQASRTESKLLDVPKLDVRVELDHPADVLVVMLGMNDVIAPYVDESDASVDRWAGQYAQLVEALARRAKPSVVALAGITPCTEDLATPKNRLIDRLNTRVRALAERTGAVYLPVPEAVRTVLHEGRTMGPDFHVTYDSVHPDDAGHMAVAMGMLRGLGATRAVDWINDNRLAPLLKRAAVRPPAISWELQSAAPAEGVADAFVFRVRYYWANASDPRTPRVRLVAPAGWTVSPAMETGESGEFLLRGKPDRLSNAFVLEGNAGNETRRTEGAVPAPWAVATKLIQPHWAGEIFDADKARTAIDAAIERGDDFRAVAANADGGGALPWLIYFPSINHLGGENASSVDFSGITHAANFEGGYSARWIYSARAREVTIKLGTRMFAGPLHLDVWLNGERTYRGDLRKEPSKEKRMPVALQQGWNALVIKSNHRTWLWQFSAELVGGKDDALSDIRYSPRPVKP
ncbi:MAG: GDSL-type esterase/lipase family protein [Opitutaceae bacterium]|jgi:lysophospholipase L1-like esterase